MATLHAPPPITFGPSVPVANTTAYPIGPTYNSQPTLPAPGIIQKPVSKPSSSIV